jgi:hypothetical protein
VVLLFSPSQVPTAAKLLHCSDTFPPKFLTRVKDFWGTPAFHFPLTRSKAVPTSSFYRTEAENYLALARTVPSGTRRIRLLEMAQSCLHLADAMENQQCCVPTTNGHAGEQDAARLIG